MKTLFLTSSLIISSIFGAYAQTGNTEQRWTPTVEFEKVSHNFGSIPEGPKAEYDFNFTNTGSLPIVVITAQAGCGCTTPEWPRYTIEPGKTAQIKVGYNSAGRPGPFTKDVNVTFAPAGNNDNQGSLKLTIEGNVASANVSEKQDASKYGSPGDQKQPIMKPEGQKSRNTVSSPIPQ
jgi:hypothetical protein